MNLWGLVRIFISPGRYGKGLCGDVGLIGVYQAANFPVYMRALQRNPKPQTLNPKHHFWETLYSAMDHSILVSPVGLPLHGNPPKTRRSSADGLRFR